MRPLSQALTELIVMAEAVMRVPRPPARFAELSREIVHAHALPAEGTRSTRAGLIMVTAIEGFIASKQGDEDPWLMLAGATLPLLRREAFQALVDEKEARYG